MAQIPRIFIAYSRQDLPQLELLRTQLRVLERREFCHIFYDGAIQAGERWDDRIKDELHRADIYLLLVTAEFLDSNYVNDIELPTILQREKEGRAKVLPVILRQCLWKYSELGTFQVILHEGRPIQEKEAYGNVAHIIAEEVARRREQKEASLATHQNKMEDLIQKAMEMGDKLEEQAKAKDQTSFLVGDAKDDDFFERAKRWADGDDDAFEPFSNKDLMHDEMVFIKGGNFEMGDVFGDSNDSEKPMHDVQVKDFYLSRYPVSQFQWEKIMGYNPSYFKGNDRLPVEMVNWDEIQEFIRILNKRTGLYYRLPSEAEWEYAAREGGKKIRFGNGKNIAVPTEINFNGQDNLKNVSYVVKGEYLAKTTPIGSFRANALGLFDMSGNVWEWCADLLHENYKGAPLDGSVWIEGGEQSRRIVRGGSWDTSGSNCRATCRGKVDINNRYVDIGFRLARS